MGCASSKSVGATAGLDVYRPAPSSFAVFDINSIQEPWLKPDLANHDDYKPATSHVPAPILEKLNDNASEATPPSTWEEISKALEEAAKNNQPTAEADNTSSTQLGPSPISTKKEVNNRNYSRAPRKSASFHTLEELDQNNKFNPASQPSNNSTSSNTTNKHQQLPPATPSIQQQQLRKTVSSSSLKQKNTNEEDDTSSSPAVLFGGKGFRSVKDNPFIIMDKTQSQSQKGAAANWVARRDPFADYPQICPPGGSQSVVLYTTSLRGIRKTFEDCSRARTVLEIQRVVFDERDVSLHAEFLSELKDLLVDELDGGGVSVPRIFIHGRYIGGADQLVELNESGRLGRMLTWARVERGVGWQGCEGCGGARFVPCLECGGSCKVVVEGEKEKERCPKCNENGLLHCPICH